MKFTKKRKKIIKDLNEVKDNLDLKNKLLNTLNNIDDIIEKYTAKLEKSKISLDIECKENNKNLKEEKEKANSKGKGKQKKNLRAKKKYIDSDVGSFDYEIQSSGN